MDEDDVRLIRGDCLEAMRGLEAGSVDLIAADLPYQITACGWDAIIPFGSMWERFKRALRPGGAVVLTASQPFTSALIMSNPAWFRYEWIWDKVNRNTGSLNANRMPMKRHENVAVFYEFLPTYNPQFRAGLPYVAHNTRGHGKHTQYGHGLDDRTTVNDGYRYPASIVEFPADIKTEMGFHPTQKPVALFEYLILTYSDPGEVVLDCTMGSGTTGVAAVNTGRRFIGIERDPDYFLIASTRIDEARRPLLVGRPLSASRRPRPAAERDPGQPTLFDSLS